MVKKIAFIWILLAIVLFVSQMEAADQYDETVKKRETETRVIYYGTVTFESGNLEDSYYTQFFQIDDCNASGKDGLYPTIGGVCSDVTGTEDVNILAHYSFDPDTSIASTLNSGVIIDNLTTTMQIDTINYYDGSVDAYFQGSRYMRLIFDGQTSNVATTVSWWVSLVKNDPNAGVNKSVMDHKASAIWPAIIIFILFAGSGIFWVIRKRKRV